MSQKFGIVIDGQWLTFIGLSEGRITEWDRIEGSGPSDAIKKWIAKGSYTKKSFLEPITVAVVSSRTRLKPVFVETNAEALQHGRLPNRTALADATVDQLSITEREGYAYAGYIGELIDTNRSYRAVGATAPADLIEQVYRSFENIDVNVIVFPFVYKEDGLYVAFHESATEISLVEGGAVSQCRVFRHGVQTLRDDMGDEETLRSFIDESKRRERTLREQPGGSVASLTVPDGLTQWLTKLGEEFGGTIDQWAKADSAIPSTIRVLAPTLGGFTELDAVLTNCINHARSALRLNPEFAKLFDNNKPRAVYPQSRGERFDAMPPEEAPLYAVALRAADRELDQDDLVVFVNPHKIDQEQRALAARQRRRSITRWVGIAAVAALVLMVPIELGKHRLSTAKTEQATAQSQLQSLAPESALLDRVNSIETTYRSSSSTEPHWDEAINSLVQSAPTGTVFQSVQASRSTGAYSLNFTVTMPGDSYNDLVNWMSQINAATHPVSLWTTQFSAQDGKVSATLTEQVDPKTLVQARPLPKVTQ